jgi:putative glutamine amidotransferase
MSPLIGITTYTAAGDPKRGYSIPCEYVDAVRCADANVLLLAAGDAADCLAPLDGLLLSGGGDIDPALYGGRTHELTYMVDRARDDFELALLRRALDVEMPVLAICRGMQLLNVALGGSLIEHVPDRFGESVAHRSPPREPVPHPVRVDAPGSRLAAATGSGTMEVVSWHHQGVDRLAEGLSITALAADGVVEALEPSCAAWVVGVQWHPELNAATDRRQASLFSAFRDACARYRRTR